MTTPFFRWSVVALFCWTFGACPTPTFAQNAPQGEPIKGSGVIKEILPNGMLKVDGGDPEPLYVMVAPNAKVSFSATAEQSWLAQGMLVRFTAKIDPRGKVESSLSHLEVVSPSHTNQPGLKAEAKEDAGGVDGLFTDDAKPKTKKKPEVAPNTTYVVIGRISAFRNQKLTVATGGPTLVVDVDEKAKVAVDYSDLSQIQTGDTIKFDGQANPAKKTQILARTVDVNAAAPFTAETKPKKKSATKTTKKDTKPAETKTAE